MSQPTPTAPNDRPNFVVVVLDQLRYDLVESGVLCATPALDRFRQRAAWFEQHYTPLGICSPARASAMTGLHPHSHGVLNNVHTGTAVTPHLPGGNPTLGELLTGAGYRTGYVGKWHLGRDGGPASAGFGDVRFCEPQDDPRMLALAQHLGSMVYTRPAAGSGGERFEIYLRDPVPPELVPANIALADAQDLLEGYSKGADPFCLVLSIMEPHHPTILTEEYVDRYDPATIEPWASFGDTFEGKPRTHDAGLHHFGVADFTWDDWAPIVARYLGTVTMLDDVIERLLHTLDELGRADDTVVVVTTDHGDMTGNHRQFNKGPLMYDDVYRIPFAVHVPGATGGTRVPELTSHLDLLPTVAELAGLDLPEGPRPGRSLVPWLTGEAPPAWRRSLMCEFHGDEFGFYTQRMVRRGAHKLVYNANDVTELYDLEADPHEMRNLALQPEWSDLRLDLEAELLALMRESNDPLTRFARLGPARSLSGDASRV